MPGLPCALQKICQGLLMQVDGVEGLTDIVEGMDVADLTAMLLALSSVTGAASSPPGRAAVEMRESKEIQDAKELEASSILVTFEQWLHLVVNEWYRRVQAGDSPPTGN